MMKCARHRSLLGRWQVINDDRPSIGEEFSYEIARRLPFLLTEKKLNFNDCNKIFSSSWISEELVVTGTKCNKVGALLHCSLGVWIIVHGSALPILFTHSALPCEHQQRKDYGDSLLGRVTFDPSLPIDLWHSQCLL